MTCIVGVEHGDKVWIGGDSAASNLWSIHVRSEPKVWADGEFAFGYCASFRYGQLLRHGFRPPRPPRTGIDKYFTIKFVSALREAFKADLDAEPSEQGRFPELGFLVALRGQLYMFHGDWQIGRCRDGFAAMGSGGEVATGSLYASRSMRPRDRLVTALSAAERYTPFVRAPFTIVQV